MKFGESKHTPYLYKLKKRKSPKRKKLLSILNVPLTPLLKLKS